MLKTIGLVNFKNYNHLDLDFHPRMNCFVGNNGLGKTNLLDAVYYLCIGKSYFSTTDQLAIKHEERFFRISGQFESDEIAVMVALGEKKRISKNGFDYNRLAEHLGYAPVVCIAPNDNLLILGSSELRRRTMNATISQFEPDYVRHLLHYNKILNQRNQNLKSKQVSEQLLDVYDEQMIPLAQTIFESRTKYVNQLAEKIQAFYAQISNDKEQVNCVYKSQLNESSFTDLLLKHRDRDLLLRRTTVGIHKDDLAFSIHENSLKKFGSQGQQKSFLFSLKLAEHQLIEHQTGKTPLLLLDDVFEKLDASRMEQLFRMVPENTQVFITDTDANRVEYMLGSVGEEFAIFDVSKFN